MAYEDKFGDLLDAIKSAVEDKAGVIVIQTPHALGDDYGELVESLKRIGAAGLLLKIVPPTAKASSDYSRN